MALPAGFGKIQEVEHKKSPGGDAEEVGHEDGERDAGIQSFRSSSMVSARFQKRKSTNFAAGVQG